MAEAVPYQITQVIHMDKWMQGQQDTVSGRQVKALWIPTQDYITVFVPDSADFVPAADQLIRAQGEQLNELYGVKG